MSPTVSVTDTVWTMLNITGKVAVAGDWHGNFPYTTAAIKHAAARGCNTIIHTGDIGFLTMAALTRFEPLLAELSITLIFADGNHDNHELISMLDQNDNDMGVISEHIYHLPRGNIFTVNGETWMTFGGAYSVNRSEGLAGWDWWHGEVITLGQVMRAPDQKVDVVVSHECPSGVRYIDQRNYHTDERWPREAVEASTQQRELMAMLVDKVRPSRLYHGHHHVRYTEQVGDMTVTGLAKDGDPFDMNMVYL